MPFYSRDDRLPADGDKFYYENTIPSQTYDGSISDLLEPPSSLGSSTAVSQFSDSTNRRGVKIPALESPSPLAKKRKQEDGPDEEPEMLWRSAKTVKVEEDSPTLASTVNDNVVVLAWAPRVQHMVDKYDLSIGVQWEITRLLSTNHITYNDLTPEKLSALRGPNADAAQRAARILLNVPEQAESDDTAFAQEKSLLSPWAELDTEIETLKLDPDAGLGNSTVKPGWYGGKVVFPLKIKPKKENRSGKGPITGYQIVLDHATLSSSTRFARKSGSAAFIRVKIAMDILRSNASMMIDLFLKPFVLWDRVFRAFFAKDDNVFLFCTNETMDESGMLRTIDNGRQSLLEFVEFHNPLREGDKQLLCKWASRMALGLSNSVPGPRIDPRDIFETPDIVSTDGTNSDLTDGCGLCNKTLPMMIYHQLALEGVPAAIQFRLGGMKGLLLQQPQSTISDRPQVTYRPSQLKIRGQPEHPSHLTIDLLRTSRMRTSVSISAEVIRNLEDNGVPRRALADLFRARITEVMEGLTDWEGSNAMLKLWATLERLGGVHNQRRAIEAGGEARARGLGGGFDRPNADEDGDDNEPDESGFDPGLQQRSRAWDPDEESGCPSGLEETMISLLASGFTPNNSSICRAKLQAIYLSRARILTSRIKFTVPQSASAFVVPDPCGVLGPNEIHIKASRPALKMEDGLEADIVVGDVLITRNPCKVPSDVRKVRAVDHPELAGYVDVIVVSAHPSAQRLLELLAGGKLDSSFTLTLSNYSRVIISSGDYDGDTCIVIWDQQIVAPFKNSDIKYATPPAGMLQRQFTRDNTTVDKFIQTHNAVQDNERKVAEIQRYLLSNLRDMTQLGMYSSFHENAIITYGYSNPRTVRLAHMFNTLMDSAKTGYSLTRAAWQDDFHKHFHKVGPKYRELASTRRRKKLEHPSDEYVTRSERSPYHRNSKEIMDYFVNVAKEEYDKLCIQMDEKFKALHFGDYENGIPPDKDLAQPWFAAEERAITCPSLAKDLRAIAAHVNRVYDERKAVQTDKRIEERQDQLRALSKKFASGPPLEAMQVIFDEAQIRRLAASYAYVHDWKKKRTFANSIGGDGWSRFPWDVAFRELCHIKAQCAVGHSQTVTMFFFNHLRMVKT
ncbi:RNA dependent RNA polymerase-domain-containing protein [Schizophyllum amplum]|uniref:RNA-dependent RNA polymerase n=1 Tax=Schizophyllum amplum TaxID=97359 RepID=A0A550BTB0_9AGAR|nr:RNA dependent RNA polymerase-domain-containing protein [Auriculariopsis ampla]